MSGGASNVPQTWSLVLAWPGTVHTLEYDCTSMLEDVVMCTIQGGFFINFEMALADRSRPLGLLYSVLDLLWRRKASRRAPQEKLLARMHRLNGRRNTLYLV
jgi:hypothetical protein